MADPGNAEHPLVAEIQHYLFFGLSPEDARTLLVRAGNEIERLYALPERTRNRSACDPYLSEYARGRYNGLTAALAMARNAPAAFLDYSKEDDGSIKEPDGTVRFVEVAGELNEWGDFANEPIRQSRPSHPIRGSEYAAIAPGKPKAEERSEAQ